LAQVWLKIELFRTRLRYQSELIAMKSVALLSLVFPAIFGTLASTQNIVQVAEGSADLSILVSALTAGGLTGTLSGKGPFTVFAPTNEAFSKLDTKALESLLANKADLDKVLEYHVLAANLSMVELMAVKIAKTFEGENVHVSNPGSSLEVNNAKVLTANVEASNGVVHIIDSVLNPPSMPAFPLKVNIVKLAESTKELSTLVSALVAADLVDILNTPGPFTVFAPTNDAFSKLPAGTFESLMKPENKKQLVDLLKYHVLPICRSSETPPGVGDCAGHKLLHKTYTFETVEGKDVKVKKSIHDRTDLLTVNGKASVISANNFVTNGVVHLIDSVLIPPNGPAPTPAKNIVELCESEKDLSTLVAAVVAAGLADTLSSSKEFTLFAPTNDAFNALPPGTLEKLMKPENKQELVDILTYHVLPEEVLSTDLKPFQAVTTVEGKPLHVTKWGGLVRVGPSLSSKDLKNVTKADNLASNGVVHIINGVLLPPAAAIMI